MDNVVVVQKKYREYKLGNDSISTVWKYFLREENGASAKCKLCQDKHQEKIIQTNKGSTSGLKIHLKSVHQIELSTTKRPNVDPDQTGTSVKKYKISSYFSTVEDKSLEAVLSRMTAKDGLSFSHFCTSLDQRDLLRSKGYTNIPTCSATIRQKVIDYGNKVRNKQKNDIQILKNAGARFGVTLDEWTSNQNKRYMNVNIHNQNSHVNLGLIRAFGKLPAEKIKSLLQERLNDFGLSIESDIIAVTTDGPNVMKKLGRILNVNQQLCYAHGLQLAVIDVLYNIKVIEDESEELTANNEVEYSSSSDELDVEGDDRLKFEKRKEKLLSSFGPLIMKVRKVVSMFRKSPTKNDEKLQKHVKNDMGKEMELILDCRTRWTSLFLMLQRFFLLKSSILKTLIDMESPYSFTEDEFKNIEIIINALEIVKLTVEMLCRRDSTLITTDAALGFMLSKLKLQNNFISNSLVDAIIGRIKERRTKTTQLLQYLHSKKLKSNEADEVFTYLTTKEVTSFLVELSNKLIVKELNPEPEIFDQNDIYLDENVDEVNSAKNKSLQEELEDTIRKSKAAENLSSPVSQNILTSIKKEMSIFETSGARGYYLNIIYNALLSIPPTSVEAERAFSAAGYFCTKVRSSLGAETLDILCSLRAYFKSLE